MNSDLERSSAAAGSSAGGGGANSAPPPPQGRTAPARPSLHDKPAAPVLVKLPAPASVRLSQLFWVLSLAVGAAAIVYLFVIRQQQLPDIVTLIQGVDETRAKETYETAADIIFWSVFGSMVAVVLVQITQLVSFSNRRPNTRWWLLGTVLFSVIVFFIGRQIVAIGDRGVPLERIMLLQLGLAVLALLFSTFPKALRWTARRHDVRRGDSEGAPGATL